MKHKLGANLGNSDANKLRSENRVTVTFRLYLCSFRFNPVGHLTSKLNSVPSHGLNSICNETWIPIPITPHSFIPPPPGLLHSVVVLQQPKHCLVDVVCFRTWNAIDQLGTSDVLCLLNRKSFSWPINIGCILTNVWKQL